VTFDPFGISQRADICGLDRMRGIFARRPLYQPACINQPPASPTIKTANTVKSAQGQDT
jgi:hypothetical protein